MELDPDMLDFDPVNKNKMKYFINKLESDQIDKLEQNQIPLLTSSKYYSKLVIFKYIGVKYYNTQLFENEINDEQML